MRVVVQLVICLNLVLTLLADDRGSRIESLMREQFERGHFNGSMLVAAGGEVICKKAFGFADMEWEIPNTPDTKFRLGSITKQFTAALILQLVAEGKVELEAPLSRYVPEYPAEVGDRVTVHQLLTHSSGIRNITSLRVFREEISRDPYEPLEIIDVFAGEPLDFTPGERFQYSNSGYLLLGMIIEKVTGSKYEEVLEGRILGPLGMNDSGYDHHETLLKKRARGYRRVEGGGYENADYVDMSLPYAAGALYSTVEDLYKWDQALCTDKVLSKKYRDLMFQPHQKVPGQERNTAYGYGWSIETPENGPTIVSHGGGIKGFSARILRIPEHRHLIVLLSNIEGARELTRTLSEIRAILYQ